jgi:hypothetical protein
VETGPYENPSRLQPPEPRDVGDLLDARAVGDGDLDGRALRRVRAGPRRLADDRALLVGIRRVLGDRIEAGVLQRSRRVRLLLADDVGYDTTRLARQ